MYIFNDYTQPKTPKPNWENICGAIIDNMVSNSYSFQKEDKSVTRRSASRRSISSGATLTSNDNSSSDVLSAEDQEHVHWIRQGKDVEAVNWNPSRGANDEARNKPRIRAVSIFN